MSTKFVIMTIVFFVMLGFSTLLGDCPEDCPTQDCLAGICAGDVNQDGCVDIGDLTCIIKCVYLNDCPIIKLLCDIDGDCDVDEDDVDYMTEYLFNQGPIPKCPYCLYIGDPPPDSDCPCGESIKIDPPKNKQSDNKKPES